MNSGSAKLSCAVLSDVSDFAQIEREWRALYRSMRAPYLSDSFEWAKLSWDFACGPRGRRLLCIVVRHLSSVVAIFPLVVSRRIFWRVASPLSSEGSEYCPFLIDPRVDPCEVMDAICRSLRQVPDLHGLYLPNVREEEALGLWLAERDDAACVLTLPAARIRFAGCADWDGYFATRSSRLRAELRRKLRSAERLGHVEFREIADPDERQKVWRWLVERKRASLARREKNDWLLAPSHADFAAATLETLGPRRPLFAMTLDGAVIAAALCSAGATIVEGFVIAHDESFARISPGALLHMHCARWALEHGLDFDLRTGREAFKSQWANDFSEVSTYALPLTWWGLLYVAGERVRRWLGLRAPEPIRARARAAFRAAMRRGTDAAIQTNPPGV